MTQPILYDGYGRMKYHPDYHARHGQAWTTTEEKYLIENYAALGPETVALGLERTIGVVMTRAYALRKEGKMAKAVPGAKTHKRLQPGKEASDGDC